MGSLAHLESTLIPLVKNLLILDTDGKRVAVKFFDSDTWCGALSLSSPSGGCSPSSSAGPTPLHRTRSRRRCSRRRRE